MGPGSLRHTRTAEDEWEKCFFSKNPICFLLKGNAVILAL